MPKFGAFLVWAIFRGLDAGDKAVERLKRFKLTVAKLSRPVTRRWPAFKFGGGSQIDLRGTGYILLTQANGMKHLVYVTDHKLFEDKDFLEDLQRSDWRVIRA